MTRDGNAGDGRWAAATLGVPLDASAEEVEVAFRHAARQHHPDTGGDAQRFRELTAARQALRREPPTRAAHNVVFVARRRPRWWTTFARWLTGRPRRPTRQLS